MPIDKNMHSVIDDLAEMKAKKEGDLHWFAYCYRRLAGIHVCEVPVLLSIDVLAVVLPSAYGTYSTRRLVY